MITVRKEEFKSPNSGITVVMMTALGNFNRSYSLTTVIIDQLRSLVIAGYKIKFWVMTTCDLTQMPADLADKVEICKVMPAFRWRVDEVDPDGAKKIRETLDKHLFTLESAIVITHDLMFIDSFVTFASVAHALIPNSKFRWFHCCHSSVGARPPETATIKRLRTTLPPGHKIICLNRNLVKKFAAYYGTTVDKITVVNNSRDMRAFSRFPDEIWDLIHKTGIMSADIVQTYAFSTLRAESKGLDHIIQVFGLIKKLGFNVKLILINAHATDPKAVAILERYSKLANDCGISDDVIWYSKEFKETAYVGAPESVVNSFMQISNVFMFPTTSEAGPLVLMEASLSGCLLILNKSVDALYDYIPNRCALYYDFGPQTYKDIATNIAHYLSNDIRNLSKRHTLKYNSIASMTKQLQQVLGKT